MGNQIESTPIQQYTITLDRLDSKGALVGHPVVEQKAPESNATQQQQLQQQLQLLQQQQQAQQQLQQNKEKEYAKK